MPSNRMQKVPPGQVFEPGFDKPVGELDYGFYIDTHETTVSHYVDCVEAGACLPPQGRLWNNHEPLATNWDEPGREEHPINNLSWAQADAYCRWRGKRLPTDLEWLRAAYGDSPRPYPWGSAQPDCQRAVFNDRPSVVRAGYTRHVFSGCGTGLTSKVGDRPKGASAFGLHDMAGNAAEWVHQTRLLMPAPVPLLLGEDFTSRLNFTRTALSFDLRGGFYAASALGGVRCVGSDEPVEIAKGVAGCRCEPGLPMASTIGQTNACAIGADFSGLGANGLRHTLCATRADFSGVQIEDSTFYSAKAEGSVWKGARLSMTGLHSARLMGAQMRNAQLVDVNLQRASANGVDFGGASLERVDLQWAVLRGARFDGASLKAVMLANANVIGADFGQARLELVTLTGAVADGSTIWPPGFDPVAERVKVLGPGASLEGAKLASRMLRGVSLSKANVRGADFTNADLRDVDLTGADLTGANLFGADLFGAKLDGAVLDGVRYSRHTRWPQGFDPREHSMMGPYLTAEAVERFLARSPKKVLKDVVFEGVNLARLDLSGVELLRVTFRDCVLDRLKVHGGQWFSVRFERTSMRGADWRGLNTQHVSMVHSDVSQMRIQNATLSQTTIDSSVTDGFLVSGSVIQAWNFGANQTKPDFVDTQCEPMDNHQCPQGTGP